MSYSANQFTKDVVKKVFGVVPMPIVRYAERVEEFTFFFFSQEDARTPKGGWMYGNYNWNGYARITINGADPVVKGNRFLVAYVALHEAAHAFIDTPCKRHMADFILFGGHTNEWKDTFRSFGVYDPLLKPKEVSRDSFKPEMLAFIDSLPEIDEW